MRPSRQKELEKIALERVHAAADDVKQRWRTHSGRMTANSSDSVVGVLTITGGPNDFGWTPKGWNMQRR